MVEKNIIIEEFYKYGGVLKTSELRIIGLSSRQIKKLVDDEFITKIKFGFYELAESVNSDEVIIARLFPDAVIFLESALMYYEYTDRIPSSWQIAVDKDSEKRKYEIEYPLIQVFYIEDKFLDVGLDVIQKDGVDIKIFDRDRTICDILRYENKIEIEVFTEAIKKYSNDTKKNVRELFEYAEILNIKKKVLTYIGGGL